MMSIETPPAPLHRQQTAPVIGSARSAYHVAASQRLTQLQPISSVLSPTQSIYAPSSSQTFSSQATTLVNPGSRNGPLSAPMTKGVVPLAATNSIVNQAADSSKSLYRICLRTVQRLRRVAGFEDYSGLLEETDTNGDEEDPMARLWDCLKQGAPLVLIYNSTEPNHPISLVDDGAPQMGSSSAAATDKLARQRTMRFYKACKEDLGIPDDQLFTIRDLFGTNTTGFKRVLGVVNRVLDIAESRGGLIDEEQGLDEDMALPEGMREGKKSKRHYIIAELVTTERKYVHHLEQLHDFKTAIEAKGSLSGDVLHRIFLNIDMILDFQRRFLVKVEKINALPEDQQRWAPLFLKNQHGFSVYNDYIVNLAGAQMVAHRESDKLSGVSADEFDDKTLNAFLTKPFQRLGKYPLLLADLRNDCKEGEDELRAELEEAHRIAVDMNRRANAAVQKQELAEARQDFIERVDDWKGLSVDGFGELMLYGTYGVVKRDGKGDVEREYTIYLFDTILICCKTAETDKQKSKLMAITKKPIDTTAPTRYVLKGRIFVKEITDRVVLSKTGSYSLQVFWQSPGAQVPENFIIRFRSEEELTKWADRVAAQHAANLALSRPASGGDRERNMYPGADQYTWANGQVSGNQYQDYESPDGTSTINPHTLPTMAPYPVHGPGPYGIPRNTSSNSLRSRSGTMESNHGRGNHPRFGAGQFSTGLAPLSVHTSTLSGTPSHEVDRSYFSPIAETPTSSRTSASSNQIAERMASQRGIMHSHMMSEDKGRPYYNESEPGNNREDYSVLRANRGPSLPANASAQMIAAQSRNRSASSPDVHGQLLRRTPLPTNQPPVPAVPAHLQINGLNRSQTNSPALGAPMNLPLRATTQSPGIQNHRLNHNKSPSYFNQNLEPYEPYASNQYDRAESRLAVAALSPGASVTSSRTVTPGLAQGFVGQPEADPEDPDADLPHQVKIKIIYKDISVSLIASRAISYASLIGRIDAKLAKNMGPGHSISVSQGSHKITYLDEDGDKIAITGDEDIKEALSEWAQEFRVRAERDMINAERGVNVQTTGTLELRLFCEEVGRHR